MHSLKRHPVPFFDFNNKQVSESDLKPAVRTVSNENYAYSYYPGGQAHLGDVYHDPESNKENVENKPQPYHDSKLGPSINDFISPKFVKGDAPRNTNDVALQNGGLTCSLDAHRDVNEYRQRVLLNQPESDSLKRTRIEEDDLSQKTKYPRGQNDSSVKSQARHTASVNAIEPVEEMQIITDIEPTFPPRTRREGTIVLDNELLDDFTGVRKYWLTNQGKEQGMSAAEVLRAIGVDEEGVMWHILHLFAFSMGGYDGVEPNEVENFTNGTAGANGFHLRIEDAIKALVRRHGTLYVHYFFEPNQSEFDKKWHVGDFTYEYGVVKNPELIDKFRAGEVEADQIRGECVNSMVINTLDKRFSSTCDANYLYVAGDVAIERIAEKKCQGTDESAVTDENNLPQDTKKFRPNALLSQSAGGEHGYLSMGSPETKNRLRKRLGSPLKPIYPNGSLSPTKAETKEGEIWNRSVRSKAIHTYTRNATEPQFVKSTAINNYTRNATGPQLCEKRPVKTRINFDEVKPRSLTVK